MSNATRIARTNLDNRTDAGPHWSRVAVWLVLPLAVWALLLAGVALLVLR